MEQSGGLVSVVVYLAILAFAVAWFLLPRWLKRRRAGQVDKAAGSVRNPKQAAGPGIH